MHRQIKFCALAGTAMLMLAGSPAFAQQATAPAADKAQIMAPKRAPKPQLGTYGFDAAGMDLSVAPGDDFYDYANGTWAKNTPIPADKANYGMFTALDDLSKERVRKIIEEVKDDPASKIGRAYRSFLDTATIEARGLTPIKPWLDEIRAAKTKADYQALLLKAAPMGVAGPIRSTVGQDDAQPDHYIFAMFQGGTNLPDRDMYITDSEKMVTLRTAYLGWLTQMLTMAGESDAQARAAAVLDLETRIARIHWTREDSSDAKKTYNKFSLAETAQLSSPTLDVPALLRGTDPAITTLLISQPSAVKGTADALEATPLQVLKDQLLINSLRTFSPYLPKAFDDATFAFFGTTLQGTPEQQERWKRGVELVEGVVGEEVGRIYAERHFPAEYKTEMNKLVRNVLDAMGRRIDALAWMQPQTKARAKAKLANFTVKVGYPDQWRDYGALDIKADDLIGNVVRSNQFDRAYDLGKLGTPIRRWEWGMLPQTVNAYANFNMMEVVFPAAILQPPFFDPNADAAVNYGGIGAVIGHEISHHFDDQGAKFDEKGALADWWTEADVAAFDTATKALIAQYDAYEPLPGEHVKGEFTLGENIGDLAGLTIAYDAYKHSLDGKDAPVLGGMTGDQRFFLGWAQVWRRSYREANLRQRLLTDPHAPSKERAAVVRNLDAWYEAFKPKAGEKLYLPPAQRVRIW
jgi:putative endopeptidase